ncbi:MAG: hypothetical protein KGI66_04290 [Patescibacteria group bacterium]|nr:hypothetical protein [Patescibacteria group bacterium]
MKLPSKSEIEKSKRLEREMEVKEGLKIAKKVDDVRVELLKAQNDLDKFKNETTKRVQSEIDSLLSRKSELQTENEILERTNKLLKEPFDKEWEELNRKRKEELDENARVIELTRIEIESEKKRINDVRTNLEANNASIESKLKEAEQARIVAKEKEYKAHKLLEETEINQAEIQSKLDAETNQLKKKEEELALTLRDIQVREAAIQKSAQALAKRERFINDKYATLQRSARALNIPI